MVDTTCPECASSNVYWSRKRSRHVCEDCDCRFVFEPGVATRSIFFSYGHDANSPIVHRLQADLESRGHDVWIDTSQIKAGNDWKRSITDGLLGSSIVLGFLSEHSVRDPGVCLDELRIALTVKQTGVQTVLLESADTVMPPSTISSIQWLDMSDWREEHAKGDTSWEEWYQLRFDELCSIVEGDAAMAFHGEITRLQEILVPALSDSKERTLVEAEYSPRPLLDRELESWRSDPDSPRALVLFGGPGSGKSSWVARQLHYNHSALCGVFLEWDKSSSSDVKSVIDLVAFKLAAKVSDYRSLLLHLLEHQIAGDRRSAASDAEYFDLLIAAPLGAAIRSDRERLILFIDGLDEADTSHRNSLTEVLAANLSRLPPWLGVVLTSRPERHILHALEPQMTVSIEAEGSQIRDDIYAFLASTLQTALANHGRRHEILDAVAGNSMGSFLYARLFAEGVRNRSIDLEEAAAYPKGLDAFFLQDFRRRFPTAGAFKPSRGVLEALAAMRVLPTALLTASLDLSAYDLNEFRRDSGSLVRRATVAPTEDGPALDALTFSHKSIADWLADPERSGEFTVDARSGAATLARHCRIALQGHKSPVAGANAPAPLSRRDAELDFRQRHVGHLFARAGLWSEFEAFLLEEDTPLLPYWRGLSLFPPGYDTAALDERLWNHPDRHRFFEALQRSGERSLLAEVLERFVASRGIASLDIYALNLYVDIVHLGGDYQRAVALCDSYLDARPRQAVLRDRGLLRLATRRLHHSMFFAPVQPLIREALGLLEDADVDSFPFEHNELLFLVGGNLGTLAGDFDFAEKWTQQSLSFAIENDHGDFEARSTRKLAEVLSAVGRLDEAESLLASRVRAGSSVTTRYDLYLLGALGEVHRLQFRPDLARQCFQQVRDTAQILGIPGWQAHGSLGLANLLLNLGLHSEAQPHLDDALRRYEEIGHAWGRVSGGIVRYRLLRAQGSDDVGAQQLHAALAEEADRLDYRYHRRILAALEHHDDIEFSLQFL